MCSGVNCWCPSRKASDWADCMKPLERSVYFSMFIDFCFRLPRLPEAQGVKSSSADQIWDAMYSRLLARKMDFLDSHQSWRCIGEIQTRWQLEAECSQSLIRFDHSWASHGKMNASAIVPRALAARAAAGSVICCARSFRQAPAGSRRDVFGRYSEPYL